MEKRAILAFVIAILIIFLYLYVLRVTSPPQAPPGYERPEAPEALTQEPSEPRPAAPKPPEARPIKEPEPTEEAEIKPAAVIQKALEKETTLSSPLLRAKFTSRGASLKEAALLEYKNISKTGPLVLLRPFSSKISSLALSTLEPEVDLNQVNFEILEESQRRVVYKATLSSGLEIIKEFALAEDDYTINLIVTIRNTENEAQQCKYRLYSGVGIEPEEPNAMDIQGIVATRPGAYRPKLERKGMSSFLRKGLKEEGDSYFREGIVWAGVANKYFAAVLIPEKPSKVDKATIKSFTQEEVGSEFEEVLPRDKPRLNVQAHMDIVVPELEPGAEEYFKFTFFVGPLREDVLARHPVISGLLDYGQYVGVFSRALLGLLRFIHKGIPNYGVAIIILTAIVRIVLHPLTRRSQTSMFKMQRVQAKIAPKIKELQEKYKGDKQRLGQEQMRLFKEEGVNPASGCMGGCLPMLLQFPIFIGLFRALRISIDLRQEPFMLWISDLSRPDTLFHLPFSLPIIGTAINILPILMVVSWIMQGKLAPQTAAMDERARQQQKMMTLFMPLIFGVMCYSFPSGVVLYWLAVTTFSGVEQYLIRKKLIQEDEPLPVKGPGRKKGPGKKKLRS